MADVDRLLLEKKKLEQDVIELQEVLAELDNCILKRLEAGLEEAISDYKYNAEYSELVDVDPDILEELLDNDRHRVPVDFLRACGHDPAESGSSQQTSAEAPAAPIETLNQDELNDLGSDDDLPGHVETKSHSKVTIHAPNVIPPEKREDEIQFVEQHELDELDVIDEDITSHHHRVDSSTLICIPPDQYTGSTPRREEESPSTPIPLAAELRAFDTDSEEEGEKDGERNSNEAASNDNDNKDQLQREQEQQQQPNGIDVDAHSNDVSAWYDSHSEEAPDDNGSNDTDGHKDANAPDTNNNLNTPAHLRIDVVDDGRADSESLLTKLEHEQAQLRAVKQDYSKLGIENETLKEAIHKLEQDMQMQNEVLNNKMQIEEKYHLQQKTQLEKVALEEEKRRKQAENKRREISAKYNDCKDQYKLQVQKTKKIEKKLKQKQNNIANLQAELRRQRQEIEQAREQSQKEKNRLKTELDQVKNDLDEHNKERKDMLLEYQKLETRNEKTEQLCQDLRKYIEKYIQDNYFNENNRNNNNNNNHNNKNSNQNNCKNDSKVDNKNINNNDDDNTSSANQTHRKHSMASDSNTSIQDLEKQLGQSAWSCTSFCALIFKLMLLLLVLAALFIFVESVFLSSSGRSSSYWSSSSFHRSSRRHTFS